MIKDLIRSADIGEFVERVLPIEYLHRGVLVSEAFAICALSWALKVRGG